MPSPRETVSKWVHEGSLRLRYLSRISRAKALRLFLRGCLALFAVESIFNPVPANGAKRILVIVIGGLGDCLLFDSLFRRLKERWPGARIDVLTGCFESMWEQLGSLDHLMVFTPNRVKYPWSYFSFFRHIRRNQYDIVAEGIAMVPMRGIYPIFTSLVFEASGAPVRIGRINTGRNVLLRPRKHGFKGRKEMEESALRKNSQNPAQGNPFLTHIVDLVPPDRRQYHESSRIFEPLGMLCPRQKDEPCLQPNPLTDRWASALIQATWGSEPGVIVGVNLETTHPIKAWPLEHFCSVMDQGIRDGLKFVILGLDDPHRALFQSRYSRDDLLNLSGKTSLAQLIAVIRQCSLFLSCDTGPAHVAQACRVPTIVLFGPSNDKEFGPVDRERHTLILPPDDLRCRPCVLGPCIRGKSCMNLISPDRVYAALAQKVLELPSKPEECVAPVLGKSPAVLQIL